MKLSSEGGIIRVGVDFLLRPSLDWSVSQSKSCIHSPSPIAIVVQCHHAQYAFMVVLRCSYSHKVLRVHPTTCTGSRFIALLNLSNGWEVSGQHHAPAALPPEKKPVPAEDTGWAPEPVWTILSNEKSLSPIGI